MKKNNIKLDEAIHNLYHNIAIGDPDLDNYCTSQEGIEGALKDFALCIIREVKKEIEHDRIHKEDS